MFIIIETKTFRSNMKLKPRLNARFTCQHLKQKSTKQTQSMARKTVHRGSLSMWFAVAARSWLLCNLIIF